MLRVTALIDSPAEAVLVALVDKLHCIIVMFVCISHSLFCSLYQVARCTKIINADTDDAKYVINVKQFAKFVVDLGDQVAPTDIEEGMRVGYDSFILYAGNH